MHYRKKKYYYLVELKDLSFEMIQYSYWDVYSLKVKPTFEELTHYEEHLLEGAVEDTVLNKKYYLLPYSYNFSSTMAGYKFYTLEEIRIELLEDKYAHNKVEV